MSDIESKDDNKEIRLPATRLKLTENSLLKYTSKQEQVAEIPLDAIRNITTEYQTSAWAIVLSILSICGGYFAYQDIENEILRWIIIAIITIIAGVAVINIRIKRIVIQASETKIHYPANDSHEDVASFIATMKSRIRKP